MELDFTTFILEIINFLVLIWLLQHFLYQPILAVIAQRKAGIEQALAKAAHAQAEAAALQEQCQQRLTQWENEKRAAQENLQREIDAQRQHMLAELKASVEDERNKINVIEERRKTDAQFKAETAALTNAAAFASLMLKRSATPALEQRLFELLLEQLASLPAATVQNLRHNHQQDPAAILISSAYPLNSEQRSRLQQQLDTLLNRQLACDYRENPELLAGLRIVIGAWVLRVNLQDELQGFIQFAHA